MAKKQKVLYVGGGG